MRRVTVRRPVTQEREPRCSAAPPAPPPPPALPSAGPTVATLSEGARQREVLADAALRARLDRTTRRLTEVRSAQVTARGQGIDSDTARRDLMARP